MNISTVFFSLVVVPLTLLLTSPVHSSRVLAVHQFSLSNRYNNQFVNDVFKENIFLTLSYLQGNVDSSKQIHWSKIQKPFQYSFSLQPNQTFAFDDDVLPEYSDTLVKTTNAHFTFSEGFKSDGYLVGDGVCHLASLLYWTAKDANLTTLAPTNHDFAIIPDVPKEYGVSIYNDGMHGSTNAMHNLYITNSFSYPVQFLFSYDGESVSVAILKQSSDTDGDPLSLTRKFVRYLLHNAKQYSMLLKTIVSGSERFGSLTYPATLRRAQGYSPSISSGSSGCSIRPGREDVPVRLCETRKTVNLSTM